jgi:SpoIVB peptidase S55
MGMAERVLRWSLLLAATGLIGTVPIAAAPAWLPEREITVGMTGIGKTVIVGTKISEFKIKVLGVLRNAGPAGDLVLFRASGPAIDAIGGLASGMSGSPIYIGGRLAGAFSYSFQFSDPTVGLFTPIEDMLKAFPNRGRVARPGVYAVAPFSLVGRTIRRVELGTCRPGGQEAPCPRGAGAAAPDDTAVAVPATTPVFVSGLGESAIEELAGTLKPMGLVPMAGPASVDLPPTLPLEPGSAIGVGLVRGDVDTYSIGTLTYREGNRILAFGHPFTQMGKTGFLLTNATILQTVRGLNRNIKVGAAGTSVGIVSEDRPAAVGGTIGVLPRMFGVQVKIVDADTGVQRDFRFQVVGDKDLAPILVALGTRGTLDRALNRSGEGTAEVSIRMRGRGLPRQVSRGNIFYSGSDIAVRALAEVPPALHLLFDNDFADVAPADIVIDVRITKARQTGTIIDADLPRGPLAPGATSRVRVTVRPFRDAAVTREIAFAVPPDFPEGPATIVVRAGSGAPVSGPTAPPTFGASPTIIRNLSDAISAFESGEKNTDVVVDVISAAPRPAGSPAVPPRVSARWTTQWVLVGRFQAPVTIGRGAR